MFQNIVNLFFPKACAGCNTILLATENAICTKCRHDIPLTNDVEIVDNAAFQKFYGKVDVQFVATLFQFQKKGITQQLIHQLKYKGHQEIGTAIGYWFAEDLKNVSVLQSINGIIPVPLHKKKLKQRGFNQVTTFGKALADVLQKPYIEDVLVRNVYSKTQTKKSLFARSDIKKDIFDVQNIDNFHNHHFLLIDDVLTTGSTLEACCMALQKIPNIKISIVCMAMTY